MPYVGQKPADIISTAVDTVTGTFSGEVDAASLALSADASVGDDLSLVSDGSIVNFGENSEISLTHVHNSGLTLASSVGATTFKIGRAGATDAKVIFDGNAQDYHIGVDDTNDSLVIGLGGTLGTTDSMVINAAGIITMPLQPAFRVSPSGTQSNIPINTTTTVAFATERFDQNGDFASNTFTAPVTGKYQLNFALYLNETDTGGILQGQIVTSNSSEYYDVIDLGMFDADGQYGLNVAGLADMDANDTAYVRVYLSNAGAAQMDINTVSHFSGFLAC